MPREMPRPAKPENVKANPRFVRRGRKRGRNRRHRPLTPRQHQRLRDYLNESDDRTAAILGSGMLENELALLILSRLRRLTRDEHQRLFDREGAPLWTFNDKIEMGYALRLYGSVVREELHRIRRIRNKFAHHLAVRKFSSHQLRDDIDALEGAYWVYWQTEQESDWPRTRSFVFARTVVDLQSRFQYERQHSKPPPLAKGRWNDRAREAFHKIFATQRARLTRRPDQIRKARSPRPKPSQPELPL
jgi:hypothetical protein